MTKWYVALPFALLGIFGLALTLSGFDGVVWGFILGVPMLAASGWFFSNRYESDTVSRNK